MKSKDIIYIWNHREQINREVIKEWEEFINKLDRRENKLERALDNIKATIIKDSYYTVTTSMVNSTLLSISKNYPKIFLDLIMKELANISNNNCDSKDSDGAYEVISNLDTKKPYYAAFRILIENPSLYKDKIVFYNKEDANEALDIIAPYLEGWEIRKY